jgi:hypothetical protein
MAFTIDEWIETILAELFHTETTVGLNWCESVRDCFRHMWE